MSSKPTNIKVIESEVKVVEDLKKSLPQQKSVAVKNVDDIFVEKLKASSGIEIPGLNKETILEKIMEIDPILGKSISDLDEIINKQDDYDEESIEEAKEAKKEMLKEYKEAKEKEIQEEIDIVKTEYKKVKETLDKLGPTINGFIGSVLLPKCIGPVSPNPLATAQEVIEFKNNIETQCNDLQLSLIKILNSLQKLKVPIPEVVKGLVTSITDTLSMLSKIPV
jgi:hypothetical protein